MVDRVYKSQIPALRKELEELQKKLSNLRSKTDWAAVRGAPLLLHARELERLLASPKFARQFSRLNKGVVLFHSDLVYLRTNVKGLEKILASEDRPVTAVRKPRP